MLHYHGTPITPNGVIECINEVCPQHFCVSFYRPDQAEWCLKNAQSVMWDNGAFSHFTHGEKPDWLGYYSWLEPRLFHPHWAVIPDSIDGGLDENRKLELLWPFKDVLSAPVYHLTEPLDRLKELLDAWPRVCFGGSVESMHPGSEEWIRKIDECWSVVARFGGKPWVHMLRAMSHASGWPFASADSASFARHHNEYKVDRNARLLAVNRRNPTGVFKPSAQLDILELL
jgi:hypothetical protein